MSDRIELNVGGRLFTTTKRTLSKYPKTLLAEIVSGDQSEPHFFDRNGEYFPFVLDFYRFDRVIYPKFVSREDFDSELLYWRIPFEAFTGEVDWIIDFNLINLYMQALIAGWSEKAKNYALEIRLICYGVKKAIDCRTRQGWCLTSSAVDPSHFDKFFRFKHRRVILHNVNDRDGAFAVYKSEKVMLEKDFIFKVDGRDCVNILEFEI